MPHAHADAGFPYDGHAAATIGSPVPIGAAHGDETVTLSALLRQFQLRLDDPLLCLPDPKIVRRRLFQVPSASTCRSRRLAPKRSGVVASPAIKRAQQILMKKLGLSCDEERLSQQQLQKYAAIFASPLGPEQVRAITAMFGLSVPRAVDDTTDATLEVADAV
jgi:hypothetical protein